jgi:uncharacterized protein YndB with AHSA1/START domain
MNISTATTKDAVSIPADEPLLVITRTFDAPRVLIYECYTDPAHMAHFWGPRDAKTIARLDPRPGGVWRIDWQYANGGRFGYTSVYLELSPPERIVYRDAPDDWRGGLEGLPPLEMHTTILLTETGGRTTLTVTVRWLTIAARDENVQRGFAGMVAVGNDRLAEYLPTLAKRAR